MEDTVLVFEGLSAWRIGLGALVVAGVFGLCLVGLRGDLERGRRAWLLSLRGLGLVLLAIIFLEPALQQRKLSPEKRRLVLAVDSSQSMGLPSGQGGSRAEAVASFLRREAETLDDLAQGFEVQTYRFDGRLRLSPLEGLSDHPDGSRTDLVAVLAQLAGQAGPDLAGVVLVSDGTDTVQLREQSGDLSPELTALIGSLGVPINTFSVGSAQGFRDLAISAVDSDDFAFIRNAVEVEVHLRSTGLEEMRVPVVLEQAGRNLATTSVRLLPGGSATASLKFVPDRVGKFVYRVSVPVIDGESLAENNHHTFVTRIIRDKIRVLHLVGRPSWDERFLRQMLKRNPNIDLIGFFILRTASDAPGVRQEEMSLIPFPVVELFGTELPTFDVVVFQNFNHGPYQVTLFLPQLANYVQEGGALFMLGGDLSFGSGGYAGTALESVLPVRLFSGPDLRVQEFRPVPAGPAAAHPVLDLGEPGIFERLPPLGSFNQAQGVVPGAVVLLEHPFERTEGGRAPLLAIREVGRGRVAALMTDGAWRWNFVHAGEGGRPRAYQRLFNNLLRWLIQDPGLQPLGLRANRSRYLPDEAIRLDARLHGQGTQARARLEVFKGDAATPAERRSVELDEGGRAEVEIGPLPAGAYRVRLTAEVSGRPIGSAEEAFVVSGTGMERGQPVPRPDLLKRLAKESGGLASDVVDGSLSELAMDEQQRYRVEASSTRPLLASGWSLAALLGLLAAEWWVRRRWGFA
jgi:uncharacterized membrane protein